MSAKASDDQFKDVPALANPVTPSMRRLRARLEGRTPPESRRSPEEWTSPSPTAPDPAPEKQGAAAAITPPSQADELSRVEPFNLRLNKPHTLIVRTQELEERTRRGEWGYMSRDSWSGVGSNVSKPLKRKALAVMNRLFKALEAEGLKVEVSDGRNGRAVHATTGPDKTPLEITEEHHSTPHVPTEKELKQKERDRYYRIPKRDVVSTGRLLLSPGGCVDLSSEAALEAVLAKTVADVKQNLFHLRKTREAEQQRRNEEWRWQREQQAEKDRVEALHQAANNLHRYRLLMDYIEEVRYFGRIPDDQRKEGQSLEDWIRWAERNAQRIHPLARG